MNAGQAALGSLLLGLGAAAGGGSSEPPSFEQLAAEGKLLQALRAALERLQPRPSSAPAAATSAPVDPSGVRRALELHLPDGVLEWGAQHDSAEALEALCAAAEAELACRRKLAAGAASGTCNSGGGGGGGGFEVLLGSSIDGSDSNGDNGSGDGACGGTPEAGRGPAAPAALPLRGFVAHETTCLHCSSAFASPFTPFYALHLPLPPAGGGAAGASLEAALARFFRDEILAGVECARCSLAASVAARDARLRREPEQYSDEQQQQAAQSGSSDVESALAPPAPALSLDLLRALAAARGPLPPLDLAAAAAAAGVEWTPVRRRAARRARLARAPAVLALHLQRTAHTAAAAGAVKVGGHVAFPLRLDAARLEDGGACAAAGGGNRSSSNAIAGGAAGGGGGWHELVAVVQHLGLGSGAGHYVVYRRLGAAAAEAGRSDRNQQQQPPQQQEQEQQEQQQEQQQEAAVAREPLPAALATLAAARAAAPGLRGVVLSAEGIRGGGGSGDGGGGGDGPPWQLQQRLRAPLAAPAATGGGASSGSGAQWVRISDAAVTRASEAQVLAAEASLLVYERRAGGSGGGSGKSSGIVKR